MNDLENLLMLDGEIFPMDSGYWVKFEVKEVLNSICKAIRRTDENENSLCRDYV